MYKNKDTPCSCGFWGLVKSQGHCWEGLCEFKIFFVLTTILDDKVYGSHHHLFAFLVSIFKLVYTETQRIYIKIITRKNRQVNWKCWEMFQNLLGICNLFCINSQSPGGQGQAVAEMIPQVPFHSYKFIAVSILMLLRESTSPQIIYWIHGWVFVQI